MFRITYPDPDPQGTRKSIDLPEGVKYLVIQVDDLVISLSREARGLVEVTGMVEDAQTHVLNVPAIRFGGATAEFRVWAERLPDYIEP